MATSKIFPGSDAMAVSHKAIVGLTESWLGRATVDGRQLCRQRNRDRDGRWWSREAPQATWQYTPWSGTFEHCCRRSGKSECWILEIIICITPGTLFSGLVDHTSVYQYV